MAPSTKRFRYISDNSASSDEDFTSEINSTSSAKESIRKPKCFSRNALLARENRLKKKIYLTNLETNVNELRKENKNYTKVIDKQSTLIANLRREIKYLKNVIVNSTDLGKLLKNIQHNTGMSVSTSVERSLSLSDYVSKRRLPIARKTAHPWNENVPIKPEYSAPESPIQSDSLLDFEMDNDSFNFDSIIPDDEILDDTNTLLFEEHNYTSSDKTSDDVGVCLHVSKHRVSLEFCSECNLNANGICQDC